MDEREERTGDDGDERDAADDLEKAAPGRVCRRRRECADEAGAGESTSEHCDGSADREATRITSEPEIRVLIRASAFPD